MSMPGFLHLAPYTAMSARERYRHCVCSGLPHATRGQSTPRSCRSNRGKRRRS